MLSGEMNEVQLIIGSVKVQGTCTAQTWGIPESVSLVRNAIPMTESLLNQLVSTASTHVYSLNVTSLVIDSYTATPAKTQISAEKHSYKLKLNTVN